MQIRNRKLMVGEEVTVCRALQEIPQKDAVLHEVASSSNEPFQDELEFLGAENARLKAELAALEEKEKLLDIKQLFELNVALYDALIHMAQKYQAARRLNLVYLQKLHHLTGRYQPVNRHTERATN
ncbi:hypothetical protein [Desulfofundulus sp.]|uniref:hypothetical protein n=1 Tax=Desulfofundulus sp. TaxID=2282750 RepID=UPI003C7507E4